MSAYGEIYALALRFKSEAFFKADVIFYTILSLKYGLPSIYIFFFNC